MYNIYKYTKLKQNIKIQKSHRKREFIYKKRAKFLLNRIVTFFLFYDYNFMRKLINNHHKK